MSTTLPTARFLRVCSIEDVPIGEGRTALVGGLRVALFRTAARTFACTDAACSHRAGPLADGLLADASVTCPLHQRRFDLASGAPIGHECGAITVHPVEVRDDEVFVCVRAAAGPGARASSSAAAA